jgi:hypothetical protein
MRNIIATLAALAVLVGAGVSWAQELIAPPQELNPLPTAAASLPPHADAALTIIPPTQPSYTTSAIQGALNEPTLLPTGYAAEPFDGGWLSGVELTLFRPFFDGIPAAERTVSLGPRLFLGWESERGFGAQGRIWMCDNEALVGFTSTPVVLAVEASRFDLDLFREFAFQGSSITVGASITAAALEMSVGPADTAEDAGVGLGLLINGRHLVSANGRSEWAMIGRGRWAGLVGEWDDATGSPFSSGDSNMQIVEAGLGYDVIRRFKGWDLVFQHLLEIQTWRPSYTNDVSFFGQSISLGVKF